MGSAPRNYQACGCGMAGEGHQLQSPIGNGGIRIDRIDNHENGNSHECEYWWCKDCRRAEWRCKDSGKGRQCDG